MRHLGILKPDTWVNLLNWVGTPLVVIYVFSMFIYPWCSKGWEWSQVQAVWYDWQSLNVGMLAFISSLIAFNITRYNSTKQRERDFLASRAFLPSALSELCEYIESSAEVLKEAWANLVDDVLNIELETEVPELPESYKAVFSRCISHAEPTVGNYLSEILVQLQVHNSRLKSLVKEAPEDSGTTVSRYNIKSYMCSLAELQALVNGVFDFSRGIGELREGPLTWEEYDTAYRNIGIRPESYPRLEDFTRRVNKLKS